ncbi:MAG: hypothetical protein JWP81_2735 [Ferruginibacter sp.]|nr:hypothetical protein [Ferruginibacter sp.]
MKKLLLVLATFSLFSCTAQTPVKADIEKALLSTWDKPATSSGPKQSATIHSIKIGTGAKANVQDKIDGIPDKATVTIAQIDFTVREYYNDKTLVTHRVMTAKVYKDQFGEWALKSNGMKVIENTSEPAK